MMKTQLLKASLGIVLALSTSCATIVGGSSYYGHVEVNNRPSAQIFYKEKMVGIGHATIKVRRKEANKLTIVVQEDQQQPQKFYYTGHTFRGWAFLGSLVTWTFVYGGLPVPAGVIVDAASGAFWKPNVHEKGVSKLDYKNFKYSIDYSIHPSASK